VYLAFFSGTDWQSWDVAAAPTIPERMPVLGDNDFCFDDDGGLPRPTAVVNRWLRELPASGRRRARRGRPTRGCCGDRLEFLAGLGVGPFDGRGALKQALGAYAVHRADGPVAARFAASTWNRHVSVCGDDLMVGPMPGLSAAIRWADQFTASTNPAPL